MRRDLPSHPHIDHLKKQAKDLLAAHKSGEAEAIERLRDALPSLAKLSHDEIRSAPIALHDAQSAIAREYGFASWADLRAEVSKRTGQPFPEDLVREIMKRNLEAAQGHGDVRASVRALMSQPLPEPVIEALRSAWSKRAETAASLTPDLPELLPLVAMRNALIVPGALAPIQIGRPVTIAAIDAAMRSTPARVAVISQREAATEDVTAEALHPVGCEAIVHRRTPPDAEGRAYVILEGTRWITLASLEPTGPYLSARAQLLEVDEDEGADEVPALETALRARARTLAAALPMAQQAIAMIDEIEEPRRLADLVIANLSAPVESKARYASALTLAERLRIALELAQAQPTPLSPAP